MKAEERKELETNALADKMGRIVQNVKSGPNRRSVMWIVIAVAVVLGFVLYVRYKKTLETEQAKSWFYMGMARAGSIEQQRIAFLAEAAKSGKGASAAGAQMETAWIELHNSALMLRRQPVQTLRKFAQLAKALAALQREFKDQPVLQAEALYHQAVIQESRAILDEDKVQDLKLPQVWELLDPENLRGKYLQAAKETYLEIRDKHKDTPYADMATKRLEVLEDEAGFAAARATYRNLAININLEETLRDLNFRLRAEALKKKELPDIE